MICGDVMAQDEWCRQLFKNEEIRQELTRVVRRKWNEVSNNMESNRKEQLLSQVEVPESDDVLQ